MKTGKSNTSDPCVGWITRWWLVAILALEPGGVACGRTLSNGSSDKQVSEGGTASIANGGALSGGAAAPDVSVDSSIAGAAGESTRGEGGASGTPIHGRVFYGYVPAEGFRVAIDGVLTTSDADGNFSFDNVGPTYELVMLDDVNHMAQVFDALSDRRPQLYAPPTENAPWTTHVQGAVSGILFDYLYPDSPANHAAGAEIMFQPLKPSGLQIFAPTRASTDLTQSFEFDPHWDTASSRDGELLALEFNLDGDVPQFGGFGKQHVTLRDGEAFDAGLIELTAAPQVAFSAAITAPAGYSLLSEGALVGPFYFAVKKAWTVSFQAPDVGLPLGLQVGAGRDGDFIGGQFFENLEHLTLPIPAAPNAPNDSEKDVTFETEFSWRVVPPKSLACAVWGWQDHWMVRRCPPPGEAIATIPDLTEYGLPLPHGEEGGWVVQVWGPAQTQEELVRRIAMPQGMNALSSLWHTQSQERSFTTAD